MGGCADSEICVSFIEWRCVLRFKALRCSHVSIVLEKETAFINENMLVFVVVYVQCLIGRHWCTLKCRMNHYEYSVNITTQIIVLKWTDCFYRITCTIYLTETRRVILPFC